MAPVLLVLAGLAALGLIAPGPAAASVGAGAAQAGGAQGASIEVHAHRGGPLEDGRAVTAENALSALRHVQERWRPHLAEVDVKYSADRRPVVIHDPALDRTTTCEGRLIDHTFDHVRQNCPINRLGTGPEGSPTLLPIANPTEPLPTLGEVLDLARATGLALNVEIKNAPTDSDFDTNSARFVDPIIDAIAARGMLTREHVLIQSFWPADLDRAKQLIDARVASGEVAPGERPFLHLLTLSQMNDGSPSFAASRGYDGLGPQWPVDAGFVSQAHGLGLRVVAWTINEEAEIRRAAETGMDGVITDDMAAAGRALGFGAVTSPGIDPADPVGRIRMVRRYRGVDGIRIPSMRLGHLVAVRCARFGVRLRVRGPGTREVERVRFAVRDARGARLVGDTRTRPYAATIPSPAFTPRRLSLVEAHLDLSDGSRHVIRLRARHC